MRPGMEFLVAELRAMCSAGVSDATVGGLTYWSDDQLQAELDKTQVYARSVELIPLPDGAGAYYDYLIPLIGGIERDGAGSGWVVRDTAGVALGSALYTVNYDARRITFNTETGGAAYFLDARFYDLNRAAATIWRRKAAFAADRVAWAADNHHVQAEQEHAHCLGMAEHYARLAGPALSALVRVDET